MAKTKQEIKTAEKAKAIKANIKALDQDIRSQERSIAASQKAQDSYLTKATNHLRKLMEKKAFQESRL